MRWRVLGVGGWVVRGRVGRGRFYNGVEERRKVEFVKSEMGVLGVGIIWSRLVCGMWRDKENGFRLV